jgi:hypothetical protein
VHLLCDQVSVFRSHSSIPGNPLPPDNDQIRVRVAGEDCTDLKTITDFLRWISEDQ